MSHALAKVLHRGRKAASNVKSACLASSRGSATPDHKNGRAHGDEQSRGRRPRTAGGNELLFVAAEDAVILNPVLLDFRDQGASGEVELARSLALVA